MPENLNLFDDLPPAPGQAQHLLQMTPIVGLKQTAAQRAFTRAVAGIEEAERNLLEITALRDKYHALFSATLQPLELEKERMNRDMVVFLDAQVFKKIITAKQRETVVEIISTLALDLCESEYAEEVQAIYEKHNGPDDDDIDEEISAQDKAFFAEQMKSMFGFDPSDEEVPDVNPNEPNNPNGEQDFIEEMLRRAMAGEAEKAERAAAKNKGRKKTAKQVKEEQQALEASTVLKAVYRKLASQLHPDREPDPAERERKTALMSAANSAYESGNLLQLLRLQLQATKVDANTAATLADDKLRVINKTLNEQLRDLEMELREITHLVQNAFRLPYGPVNGLKLQNALDAAVAVETRELAFMAADLNEIKANDKNLKTWIKAQAKMMREHEKMEAQMFNAMMRDPSRSRKNFF